MLASLAFSALRFLQARKRLFVAEADYRISRENCAACYAPDAYLRLAVRPESIVRVLDTARRSPSARRSSVESGSLPSSMRASFRS